MSTFQAAVDIETLIRRDKEFLEVKVQAVVGRMTKTNIIAKVMPKKYVLIKPQFWHRVGQSMVSTFFEKVRVLRKKR